MLYAETLLGKNVFQAHLNLVFIEIHPKNGIGKMQLRMHFKFLPMQTMFFFQIKLSTHLSILLGRRLIIWYAKENTMSMIVIQLVFWYSFHQGWNSIEMWQNPNIWKLPSFPPNLIRFSTLEKFSLGKKSSQNFFFQALHLAIGTPETNTNFI